VSCLPYLRQVDASLSPYTCKDDPQVGSSWSTSVATRRDLCSSVRITVIGLDRLRRWPTWLFP